MHTIRTSLTCKESDVRTYQLFWSPEGRCIAIVRAKTPAAAIRKAPLPYRKYLGEIYATEL